MPAAELGSRHREGSVGFPRMVAGKPTDRKVPLMAVPYAGLDNIHGGVGGYPMKYTGGDVRSC